MPKIKDVIAASKRIQAEAVRTPLLHSKALDNITGCHVFIKPENLQRTGSFKFRGAYNAVSQLSADDRGRGIVACSSGNHAQGVAAAAALFGAKATIVMPKDAPALKVERTRGHGANVVFYDRKSEDREAVTAKLVDESGAVFIHPFNNENVIAGQGTVGLEIVEDLQERKISPNRVLICTGGGGLTAGVVLAVNHFFPDTELHSCEPEGFDDYRRSLESHKIVENQKTSSSICDAILTPSPGEMGFEINREKLSDGLVISDDQALAAVRIAFQELKLVVEPGGAAALAGLLKHCQEWQGETIVIVLSGGNIDPAMMARACTH
ncbi:MAG: threonine/serine dehydratase [Pseudomonadota bacterium]